MSQNIDFDEEDAAQLQFPKEFQETTTLMNSEVKVLLEHRMKNDEGRRDDVELSEVFQKTLDYCKRFSKFKNQDVIVNVRTMLTSKRLHRFEIAALANLCPETADEAKALIPSMEGRFPDEELQQMLDDMATQRSFQS
ncbi:unnamed protein product [Oikopleura dioica]|uniref:RNA polymerase Rpb4/RPC9 core domain-containing protein n=1 Tax=Oikopleura dioica TaxID=34765 RepID=E4XDN9_OIKDI|nr:unnamed protein product [Oikopleura dioica]CBY43664.1 unnamed protein product [Oikopleura dioica]